MYKYIWMNMYICIHVHLSIYLSIYLCIYIYMLYIIYIYIYQDDKEISKHALQSSAYNPYIDGIVLIFHIYIYIYIYISYNLDSTYKLDNKMIAHINIDCVI